MPFYWYSLCANLIELRSIFIKLGLFGARNNNNLNLCAFKVVNDRINFCLKQTICTCSCVPSLALDADLRDEFPIFVCMSRIV